MLWPVSMHWPGGDPLTLQLQPRTETRQLARRHCSPELLVKALWFCCPILFVRHQVQKASDEPSLCATREIAQGQ